MLSLTSPRSMMPLWLQTEQIHWSKIFISAVTFPFSKRSCEFHDLKKEIKEMIQHGKIIENRHREKILLKCKNVVASVSRARERRVVSCLERPYIGAEFCAKSHGSFSSMCYFKNLEKFFTCSSKNSWNQTGIKIWIRYDFKNDFAPMRASKLRCATTSGQRRGATNRQAEANHS